MTGPAKSAERQNIGSSDSRMVDIRDSFGDTSVGITFPLTLAGFATMVLPSLLYVPIEEKARAPGRFKVTRDSAQANRRATFHFWVKEEGQ